MSERKAFSLPTLYREITDLYTVRTHEMALIRAAHLNAVVRHTPYAMGANIGNGALVFWAFHGDLPPGLWIWWAALTAVSLLALLRWARLRGAPPETASPRAVRRATIHAGILASIWAFLPLIWFPEVTPQQQILIGTLLTGMLSAGAFVLSSLPFASLTYVAVFFLAAIGALLRAGDPVFLVTAALMGFYAPMVAVGSLFSWRKATALLLSQAEAVRQERTLAVLLQDFEQNAGDALWEIDADGRLTHISPRLSEFLSVSDADFRAQPLTSLLQSRSSAGLDALHQALTSGRPFRELQLALSEGDGVRHLSMNGKPLSGADGRVLGWRGVLADVTEKVVGQERLHRLAHIDSLTGLSNRFTFRDGLTDAVAKGRNGAVFIIDLDHFKTINDTLGHAAGDELLKAVSLRLRDCVGPNDLSARLGGDEFALLVFDIDAAVAATLAQTVISEMTKPVNVQGRHLRVGASVGVAFCREGSTPESLMIQADTALYASKGAGRGRHSIFSQELGEQSRRRGILETGLGHAIERGQMSMHWQPRVDVATWTITGAEGLLRWDHPDLGRVKPAEFIAIAEQCGQIEAIGQWAVEAACRASIGPLGGLTISVNLSPLQLRDGRLIAFLRDAIRERQLNPQRLEFEVTETVLRGDSAVAVAQLRALRELGFRVTLDDFGVGVSSLSCLRQFPFDSLKIDRVLLQEAMANDDARAIVETIAKLAGTLNIRAVSEGVETADQLDFISRAGCVDLQGYLISPALPLEAFQRFRRSWTPDMAAAG